MTTAPVPLLSVVVPIYNVGSYLAPCLDSLLAGTLQDLEIICIDDGSTDGSGEVAERYAVKDGRLRVLHVQNGGLGRARNIGSDEARGRYLAFADSDDRIPRNAYELLCGSLEGTGSDLAAGRVRRFNDTRSYLSGLHKRAIPSAARRTHISRMPSLVYDTTAWNKVYRRSFWDEHQLRFPEGVVYEDIPVTVPAHVLAEAVDLLTSEVYEWRDRGDGSMSITQRRAELKNLQDRVTALEFVSSFLAERELPRVSKAHDLKVLTLDMPLYLSVLDVAGSEYQEYFARHIKQYLAHVDDDTMAKLGVWERVAFELLKHDRLEEAVNLVATRNTDRSVFDVKRRGVRNYAQLPYLRDRSTGVPVGAYNVSRTLPLRGAVEHLEVQGDTLVITGYAFVEKVSLDHPWSAIRYLELRGKENGHRLHCVALPRHRLDITAEYGIAQSGYDHAGFVARLPLKRLRAAAGDTVYSVRIKFLSASARRGAVLRCAQRADVTIGPIEYRADGTVVTAHAGIQNALRITIRRAAPQTQMVRFAPMDRSVEFAVRLAARLDKPRLTCWSDGRVGDDISADLVPDPSDPLLMRATLPLAAFQLLRSDEAPRTWRATVDTLSGEDETRRALIVTPDFKPTQYQGADVPRELAARIGGGGRLFLIDRRACSQVTAIRWDAGELVVQLDLSAHVATTNTDVRFTLYRDGRDELAPASVSRDGAAVMLRFAMFDPAGSHSQAPGTWSLRIHERPAPDDAILPFEIDHTLPGTVELDARAGSVEASIIPGQRTLRVRLRSGRVADRGPRNQELRRTHDYPAARSRPLQDAVLFQAWGGKQYSCNPRAIFEEMQRQGRDERMVWVRRDTSVAVPDSVRSVLLWSSEYYEALATSRYVVSNDSMPTMYDKRDGSAYLQTWHGTPLKRIAFDIVNANFGNPRYLEEFAVEVTKWDQLISPNAYSTEIFRRAFDYPGEVLETGYPRNDVFYAPDVEQRRAGVRARLGLQPHQRVVLWAPTWREDQRDSKGRYSLPLPFDLSVWDNLLGADDVLLFRGHHLLQETVGGMLAGARSVRNVTYYPDIQDLYLAADVLITDYSSVMFDFANTRRPMIFYAWDLDIYRDNLRGFYVDFEDEVPGPLVTNLTGLRDVMADLDGATAATGERYDRFVQKYCGLDDGHAASRVVSALFGECAEPVSQRRGRS